MLPVVRLLPIKWVYPTGKQQEKRVRRAPRYYHWAEVIAGDGHMIRRFLPDRLEGQTVITQTVRRHHLKLYKECGIRRVITSTPEFDGESFATNVMEGVLVTLLRERGVEPTEAQYGAVLGELGWRPGVIDVAAEGAADA